MVRTAFISTYPPRHCGIATFTHNLALATGDREIVALHPPEQQQLPYPAEVHHRIRRDEFDDYVRIAGALHECVEVVSIQHEFRIWGSDGGANVVDFAKALRVPAVATLHAVPRVPTRQQGEILTALVASVEANVVMSHSAAALLINTYGASPRRVHVIPHGVPDLPLVDPATIKPVMDLEGFKVILSFGLMAPGKGYELAIDAMPAVAAAHPTALYVIVGSTHADLLRQDGEAYREALVARVEQLGMGKHVRFVDRFIGRVELTRWLEAADVFVTPYSDLDQSVSGTLTYAMGAGRAIVSTPFAYAAELLADGRGLLFAPGSPAALSTALIDLLGDDDKRAEMGRRAHAHTRGMVWSEVAANYRELFANVAGGAATAGTRPASTAPVNAYRG